jgi:CRP/FNR family cyclic AMP-dependent transcriptional regulator
VGDVSSSGPQPQRLAALLDLDPDLGQSLDPEGFEEARRRLAVRVRRVPAGAWDNVPVSCTDPGALGLLVVDGVLSREVLVSDIVSSELLGPGEVVRPWEISPEASLLRVSVRWSVLADARVAVLDRRLAVGLAPYPEITSQLVERISRRAQRIAVTQAISQLNRVDQRLLTLLWHLAERWGRITPAGVLIPLTLSHRMLSQLIGARRPTVSTALGELDRSGDVRRLENGTWLLTGDPVGEPAGGNVRLIAPRRRLMPSGDPARRRRRPGDVATRPPDAPATLRTDSQQMSAALREACERAASLSRRAQALRRFSG